MEKLRRVQRAAARLIGGFRKFDHISYSMRYVLHWLPFPQRISYSLKFTGLFPWCGGVCLAGRPPICASSAALSSHVQAVVVRSGPLLTVIWWSHSPALRQCRPVYFLWLAQKPGMDFRSKAPPKRCLFSIPPPSKDCSFPLGLG